MRRHPHGSMMKVYKLLYVNGVLELVKVGFFF